MSSCFKYDFYRMTGEKYRFSPKNIIRLLFKHNLKFMWWWRHKNSRLLKPFARLMLMHFSKKYGLEIGNAKIGKGLYLGHAHNITINELSIIGENVNIHKGATVGMECRGKRRGVPTIGNNVYIGVNSTVVGKITVGDDVMIAPNTFVNFDVPSHSIVIGNPASVKPRDNATESYINFLVSEID